jgi:hypothetical protein
MKNYFKTESLTTWLSLLGPLLLVLLIGIFVGIWIKRELTGPRAHHMLVAPVSH